MTNSRNLVFTALALFLSPLFVSFAFPFQGESRSDSLLEILDSDGDGTLDPYEALDSLLQLEEKSGEKLTSKTLNLILEERASEQQQEAMEVIEEMDANDDGKIQLDEMDQEMRSFGELLDQNQDGEVSVDEIIQADFADQMFLSAEEIAEEVTLIFQEIDGNRNGFLEKSEANETMSWSQILEADSDQDQQVTAEELTQFFRSDNQRAEFQVTGNQANMAGVINADTPAKVLRLIFEHPKVRTIVMRNVPGSIDDEANLRAARYIRKFGFATSIRSNGSIASGGTDFFLAGEKRMAEPGAKLGIHSWGGPGYQGKDVPRDDPQHQLYLKFYEEMDIPAEFYWRTLEAAPANDIHWMTPEEIELYKMTTEPNSTAPSDSQPPRQDPEPETDLIGEAKMMLNLLDLNNNGQLEREELEGDASEMLADLDANRDGIITTAELAAVQEPPTQVHNSLARIDTKQNTKRIVDLPQGIHPGLNRHFKKYTNVLAPNGSPIHFLAMDGWSDDRILRVRKVLEHFLRDVPNRQWGHKTPLANAMANNHATMVLLNDSRDMDRVFPDIEDVDLQMQDLRANESPFEGESDYLQHQTRDAAYEEVFHLIHAAGVLDAMKAYDREIRRVAEQAKETDLWNYDEPNMPGNHFEYIICVYDNYLDLWKTKPTMMESRTVGKQPRGQSFFGEYKADQRANTRSIDPDGFSLVEQFNPDHISYTAELPASFQGEFHLRSNDKLRYSQKATHLKNVTLRGSLEVTLTGNSHDNRLVGNSGDNRITGNGGDDSIFGGEGIDSVVLRGIKSQYVIRRIGDVIEVQDSMVNRDGHDVLSGIERLVFENETVSTDTILSSSN